MERTHKVAMKSIGQEKRNKVLFVNHCLTGGGSEKAMTSLANYFAAQGFEVEMLLLSEQPRTYSVNEKIKIKECYCPIDGNKIVWHFKRIKTIREAIKKSEAPVIITFMWDISMNVILACAGLRKKIIASERCDPHNEPRKLMWLAMHFILPFADMTVFQTPMVQSYYPRRVQRRSVVIPNAIADNIPEPDRNPAKIKKEIIGVGRFAEQKNFEMLINAFAEVYRKYPDYKLIIYGDGPLRSKYEDLIIRLGLSDAVRLPGYLQDVNERMSYATLYVNSSNYEGISNAMLEAMAMGIPCICTDCPVGGASLIIRNEYNGLLVPVGDSKILAEAIFKLMNNIVLYHQIQDEAKKIRITNSVHRIGEQWLDIIINLDKEGLNHK